MTYTIKAYLRANGQNTPLAECERKQQPAAFKTAQAMAKKHKPKVHPNFGLTIVAIYKDGSLIGGYKSWRDGEIRQIIPKEKTT